MQKTKATLESEIRGLQGSCSMYSAQVERLTAENKALAKANTDLDGQVRWLRQIAQYLVEAIRTRS